MTEPIDPVDSVIAAGLRGQEFHEHLAVIAEQETRAVQRISDEAGDGLTVRVTVTDLDLRFDLTLRDTGDGDTGDGETDTGGGASSELRAEAGALDHQRGMFVGDLRERVARRLEGTTSDPVAALDGATRDVVRALLQLALMEVFDLTDPTEEDLVDGATEFTHLLSAAHSDLESFAAAVKTHAAAGTDDPTVDGEAVRTLAVRELAWRIANDEELLDLDELTRFVAAKLA